MKKEYSFTDHPTSETLLGELKGDNQQAWNRFYDLYAPCIFGFARQRGFDCSTAEDILQETMYQLMLYLPKFQYSSSRGRFRSYLYRVILSCIRKKVAKKFVVSSLREPQKITEFPDLSQKDIWDEFEQKRKNTMVRYALHQVRERVDTLTWKSFEYFTLHGKVSASEVADTLHIDRNCVYQHKHRVIELLKKEIKQLQDQIGDGESLEDITHNFDFMTMKMESEIPDHEARKRFLMTQSMLEKYPPTYTETPQLLVIVDELVKWVSLTKRFSIGTSRAMSLQLQTDYISRNHCNIEHKDDQWYINDLHSTNGLSVNGKKTIARRLYDGDVIQIGNVFLLFISNVSQYLSWRKNFA